MILADLFNGKRTLLLALPVCVIACSNSDDGATPGSGDAGSGGTSSSSTGGVASGGESVVSGGRSNAGGSAAGGRATGGTHAGSGGAATGGTQAGTGGTKPGSGGAGNPGTGGKPNAGGTGGKQDAGVSLDPASLEKCQKYCDCYNEKCSVFVDIPSGESCMTFCSHFVANETVYICRYGMCFYNSNGPVENNNDHCQHSVGIAECLVE